MKLIDYSHWFCKKCFALKCKELKIRQKDVSAFKFSKNDSHYEVHVPVKFAPDNHGLLGTGYRGCCKYNAMSDALNDLIKLKI